MLGILRKGIKEHHERFRFYDSITGMSKILRRYFVMNSFDGALTIFGMLLGSFLANVTDASLIIAIGMSTSIAIGFSGMTGALLTERAERDREIKAMELALQRDLHNTDYKKAYESASLLAGVVDGLSPIAASLLLLSPFFFVETAQAYYYSFCLALLVFFGLGAFLGKISKANIIITGLKLVVAGLVCMLVIMLLGVT